VVLAVISYLGHVKPFHADDDDDADDDADDDDDDDDVVYGSFVLSTFTVMMLYLALGFYKMAV